MAGEYPDQARILQLPNQGLRACCLILLEVPMKCQDTEKEVIYLRKEAALQILVNEWDLSEEELVHIFLTIFSS